MEQGGGHAVEGPPVSPRLAIPPTTGVRSLAVVQKGAGGFLCLLPGNALPAVILSGRGRTNFGGPLLAQQGMVS